MMIRNRPITGRRVLTWVVAFFGFIFAVNGVFVYLALDSWPGLATPRAYEEGLAYNRTLEEAEAQAERGWRGRVALGPATPKGRPLSVVLAGRNGKPLTGLRVTGAFRRALGEGLDVKLRLSEERPGVYGALVRLPKLGRWNLIVAARDASGQAYRMLHELEVAP